jgi:uncharacterized protein (DUF1778 family)
MLTRAPKDIAATKARAAENRRTKRTGAKNRSLRVEARITPENLDVIRRAAEIQGRSVSDFLATAGQEVAHRVIEETHIIRLSVEDQRRFAEALLNPPEPNEALRRAFESHRRLLRSDV